MEKTDGMVYLIGAGPGDPELITVKGKRYLDTCDTVVYDALVNEMLVARLPARISRVFVGKRGGKPSAKQDEINRILEREARKGKRVARLKGGDSLVFGRGSEEMEYLAGKKIAYEVVPGISSSIAAPTYAGIPVTHRSISRSFAVATGHLQEGEGADTLQLPTADTVIMLMAMENLQVIVDKMLADGKWTKKTPAALIRNGTLPDQQTVIGTLGTIVKLKERHSILPPAVFVVGETVAFAKNLAWQKKKPLAGCRVAVLRTNEQSGELVDALVERGAIVLSYPIMRIEPRTTSCRKITASYCKKFSTVIFTSPNGAGIFMEQLLEHGGDARSFSSAKIYAMGGGTAAVLKKFSILVDALPETFVAEGLIDCLPEDLSGENILIPRAAVAREILPKTLEERGAKVTVLPVYDTIKMENTAYEFRDGDYVLFTSSSTVDFFYSEEERRALSIHPVCIGAITAETLRKYHAGTVAVAKNATIPDLVTALEKMVHSSQRKR